MAAAWAAWLVVPLSELAGGGLAAPSVLWDARLFQVGPPVRQEGRSSTSESPREGPSSTWVLYAAGSYCNASGSPQFVELPDGLTVDECQDAALANSNCGDLVQSNAPHGYNGNPSKCMCTEDDAPGCSTALSSVGNNLYRYVAATRASTTATQATMVLYAASRYCPEPHAGHATDLGPVSTVQECLSLAVANSNCVDLIQTNAPHGRLDLGEQPSCICTSTALCPLSGVENTSVFNNIYEYEVATTWMVEFSYTATETLPVGVTSSSLMSSPTYIFVKKTGLASALNTLNDDHAIVISEITITGCSVNAANVVRQYVADRVMSGSTVQYSVSTSGTVQVAGESEAQALSNTIRGIGIAAEISSRTNNAADVADWSGEQMFNDVSPTRRDQRFVEDVVDGQAVVIELTPTPASTPTESPTPTPTAGPTAPPAAGPTAPPTASPTAPPPSGGSAQATGDPHLANVLGQRFDLRKEGWHTLVRVPQGAKRGAALLSVEAEARQMGIACADMYFQSVNLTGRWAGSQGRVFHAGRIAKKKDSRRWLRYGMVEFKVVQGHTKSGIVYLNLFVRHLKSAGYPVGGILGMDDHTAAAEPSQKCRMRISLLAIDGPVLNPEKASTAAADLE